MKKNQRSIDIHLRKPRNPIALDAKQRHAGAMQDRRLKRQDYRLDEILAEYEDED